MQPRYSGGATLHSSEQLPREHPNNFHTGTIWHLSAAALLLLEIPWPPATILTYRPRCSFGFPRQQLRQLNDACRNLPRLVFSHEIGRSASARLRLEVDIRDGKVIGIADDIGDAAVFLDSPRCARRPDCSPPRP